MYVSEDISASASPPLDDTSRYLGVIAGKHKPGYLSARG